MRKPITVDHTRTLHWFWPGCVAGAFLAVAQATGPAGRPMLKDRLCALGIMALVLLTLLACSVLAVTELAPYHAAAAPAGHQVTAPAQGAASAGQAWRQGAAGLSSPRAIDANALTIISTVINLLIFVALGLYLKWDAGRKH